MDGLAARWDEIPGPVKLLGVGHLRRPYCRLPRLSPISIDATSARLRVIGRLRRNDPAKRAACLIRIVSIHDHL